MYRYGGENGECYLSSLVEVAVKRADQSYSDGEVAPVLKSTYI